MNKILPILLLILLIKPNLTFAENDSIIELKIDTNSTFEEVKNFIIQLDSNSILTFWALSHPELSDPGVDWKVILKDNELTYRLWWHEWLCPWTNIRIESLTRIILKNSSHTKSLTITPK